MLSYDVELQNAFFRILSNKNGTNCSFLSHFSCYLFQNGSVYFFGDILYDLIYFINFYVINVSFFKAFLKRASTFLIFIFLFIIFLRKMVSLSCYFFSWDEIFKKIYLGKLNHVEFFLFYLVFFLIYINVGKKLNGILVFSFFMNFSIEE